MANDTVHVIATITAHPDNVAEVKSILLSLIGPTRQEQGCIVYELLHNTTDSTDFVFDEEWESHAALDRHLETAHIAEAVAKLEPLIATLNIQRYQLVA